MYRFLLRPRWLAFHLLVILLVVVMVNLGFWQLRRLDQRRAFNDRVESRIDLPVAPLDEVLTSPADLDDLEWRAVEAKGRYLAGEQLLLVNRSQGGRAGDDAVTPLQLSDGSVILVNRGFVPLGTDVPDAPAGDVTVVGRLRPSQDHRLGQLSDPGGGRLTEIQRIDLPRLEQQLGELLPMYIEVPESVAPPGTIPEGIPRPDLSDGPHQSYAVQWFIFSTCAVVGWVFAVRHSVAKAARNARPGAAAVTDAGAQARPSAGTSPPRRAGDAAGRDSGTPSRR